MLTLPNVVYAQGTPYLVRQVSTSRAGTRAISSVEYGDPFHQADVVTGNLSRSQRRQMDAFIKAAGSGMQTIDFSPSFLGVPAAYENDRNNAALSDNGVIAAFIDRTTVDVNSLTNGLIVSPGDLVGFSQNGFKSMHTIVAGGIVSGSALTLMVEPFIPGYIGVGAVVKFKDMGLNMRMVPGSAKMGDDWSPVASFTLVEVPK